VHEGNQGHAIVGADSAGRLLVVRLSVDGARVLEMAHVAAFALITTDGSRTAPRAGPMTTCCRIFAATSAGKAAMSGGAAGRGR
jgi:hypothetical protein